MTVGPTVHAMKVRSTCSRSTRDAGQRKAAGLRGARDLGHHPLDDATDVNATGPDLGLKTPLGRRAGLGRPHSVGPERYVGTDPTGARPGR